MYTSICKTTCVVVFDVSLDVCSVVLRYKGVLLHVWISIHDIVIDMVHDNAQLLIGTFEVALKQNKNNVFVVY